MFKDCSEISQAEYDQFLDQRLQNTGKVSGVFEMDFDKDTFSAVNAMDGWHTYHIHDMSMVAYSGSLEFRGQCLHLLFECGRGCLEFCATACSTSNFVVSDVGITPMCPLALV